MDSVQLTALNIDYLRYSHNISVHFPIGVFFAAMLVVVLALVNKKQSESYRFSFQILIYFATFATWVALIFGHLTTYKAGYQFWKPEWLNANLSLGSMILTHRLLGFIEALFLTLISLGFWKNKLIWLSKPFLLSLIIASLFLLILSHFGAAIRSL